MSQEPASSSRTLDRLLESVVSRFTPEMARMIAEHQPPADVQARLDELAVKNFQDEMTPEEKDEYEGVVQIVHALAMLRAKILTRPQGAVLLKEATRHAPRIEKAVTLNPEAPRLDGLEAMLDDMDI
ncbi:MAG: hypothetical protein P4L85_11050 [Paludisphaera borealis]|uniref:hypothetical protein n=1 Tax=Paludisphaera borealis TaxID=1387353 RepID=UPI00284749A6|nr:hypothetical protein [Paludisphaera borealis]MDR3619876.1 hypothetical protein [Paludisphaera borealis]